MEENQTVPAMIPEGDFAAFLEGEKVETLLSPLGYAYCAEGQDADLRVKRLERLEVTACRRGATPAQMEDWRMLRDRELDVEWMLNRDSVRSKARWVALQGSPLQTIASVQPREAEYLAEPYLPRGMITILAGHAGQGKTTLALWLASHVSNGDLMPGGKPERIGDIAACVGTARSGQPLMYYMGAGTSKQDISAEQWVLMTTREQMLLQHPLKVTLSGE